MDYCRNKILVNVDPRKVIILQILITLCPRLKYVKQIESRKLKGFGVKEFPLKTLPNNLNLIEEIKKISSYKYLEMTIYPLLHSVKY